MATGLPDSQLSEDHEKECAVCLQPYVHPARLPCGHTFCFLCIKGIVYQSKRCAMCRQEIPSDFLDHPNLLNVDSEKIQDDTYEWFYEGRSGWWQYDERTSKELESAYKAGERTCELLIAGFLYVMDLEALLQFRRNDPSRKRKIKRDLATIDKKGVAGLRKAPYAGAPLPTCAEPDVTSSSDSDDESEHCLHSNILEDSSD